MRAFDQIVSEGCARGDVSAWLIAGDIYDQRSTIDDRNTIAPRLQLMADTAPVVMLAGNHDADGDLEILARLKARYPIHVIATPQVVPVVGPTGDRVLVVGVPYPHRGGLVAAGVEGQLIPAAAADALERIALDLVAQLSCALPPAPAILIGHGTIGGALSSVGQPMGLDRDIVFTSGFLGRFGDIPKVFGHIHRPQSIIDAHYTGSIAPCDFGEVEAKRYLVINLVDDGPAWSWSIDSCPIATPVMYHVEGQLSREAFTWRVTRGPEGEPLEAPATWAGSEVRVRYTFNAAEKSALDTARILAEFATADKLKLEPVALRSQASRAPEVAAARTTDDKVEAFLKMGGHLMTDGLRTKLAVLQQPDAATFLHQVQTAITTTTTPVDQFEVVEL